MAKGSVVGNIARDLGLDLKRLKSVKPVIFTGDSAESIELNRERGVLLVKRENRQRVALRQTRPVLYICRLFWRILWILQCHSRDHRYQR
ncbi:hypothetical protein FQN60_010272 [Etheostoma spectabile]|uniref:Cadherin N-terminal domain-containing protein n=1 Tax=Etheostoma spectabile TaxID=54343 RepID=A0A5J5D4E0_9PERO|nr:hypothetical protein FQN60_010272 [Etheostoma spectabile]